LSHLLVHLELLSMANTFFNLNSFWKFRFLQKSAKTVVVLAYVLNAMVKDLCSRNCQRKVLRRQDWLQRIWPLDIQQGILSSTLSLSLKFELVHWTELNWTMSGFQRNGATVQGALLLETVVLAVVVES